ncbi:MAG: hypothetical protein KUL74_04755 [Cloacibacterium sp.]|nr:hypothetical protein [Cloacibacterium sp.]
MANGRWFSFDKEENTISINSIDFLFLIPFLRGRNFHLKELSTLINNEETSLLNQKEPTFWVTTDHHIYLSSLLEDNDDSPICKAVIELEKDGLIVYDFGTLTVKYPLKESLKEATIKLLKTNGYFAANLVWDFCSNYKGKILLDFILCKEEQDITDEFEKILDHNKSIDDFFRDYN